MTEPQKKVKALSLCGYCGNQDECFEKEDCMTRISFIDDQHERDKKVIASHSSAKESSDAVLDEFVGILKRRIIDSNLQLSCFDRLSMIIHESAVELRLQTKECER